MVCLLDLIKKLCCFVFLAPTQMLYGFVETRWLGWQFLNGVWKQHWQAVVSISRHDPVCVKFGCTHQIQAQ
jgi:hypothetical protein